MKEMGMMKKLISKWGAMALLSALAVPVMALHEQMPPGAKFSAEQSQQAVAAQQAYQGRMGEVGTVQRDTDANPTIKNESTDAATQAMKSATQQRVAEENLRKASERVDGKKGFNFAQIWILLGILVAALAGYAGFQDMVKNRIPEMPVVPKKKRFRSKNDVQ